MFTSATFGLYVSLMLATSLDSEWLVIKQPYSVFACKSREPGVPFPVIITKKINLRKTQIQANLYSVQQDNS